MFKVYSASAGSGKTYNLVLDYLALCFSPNLNAFMRLADKQGYECTHCSGYQNILAITFTNNAGAEMKERVVKFLNKLAFAQSADELDANDFSNLCKKVFEGTNQPTLEECFIFLNRNAKELLRNVLYDYARFSITTIDSFIQRVIRNSALYLQLSMNYAVQIRLTDFFRMAIEQYVCELAKNKQQFEVVVKELSRQLEDKGNANINRFLSKGLGIIYYDAEKSHPFLKHSSETSDLLDIISYWQKEYHVILERCKQDVRPISEEACKLFENAKNEGIEANGQKKWDVWFANIANDPFNLEKGFDKSKIHSEMDETTVFKKGKAGTEDLKNIYAAQVKLLFEQIQTIVVKMATKYFTFQILSKSANHLLVLDSLKNHIEKIKDQTDSFFLSESNPLLNDVIQKEGPDTPVFEKLQTYKNFFIDEFQDTSLMQWEDLKPLIINALGENGSVTLFGDVKQSIYRFRNGDTELFYRLSSNERLQSTDSEKDIASLLQGGNGYRFEPLKTNHRSRSSVVDFNNFFFQYYAEALGKTEYYSDVIQEKRTDKKGGMVNILGYNKKDYRDIRTIWPECTDEFYQSVYLNLRPEEATLLYAVKDAERHGYSFGEMAVLLSGRAKCNDFAQCLMLADIPVITSESLQLCDNPNINLIISFLRLLLNSNDILSQTVILHFLTKKHHKDFNRILHENICNPFFEIIGQHFGIQNFESKMEEWKKNPFLMTVQKIVRFCGFESDSDPFIADFIDLAFEFSQSQIASIADFLTWWDDLNRYQETIPRLSLSNAGNAVRLMTIHASKGLEFPVVLTHCSSSRAREGYYWVTDPGSGQSCYVKHEKNIKYSDFEKEFEEEEKRRDLDNLNLWYVDFTRARDVLYILTEFSDSKSASSDNLDIKKALRQYINAENSILKKTDENTYSFCDEESFWKNPDTAQKVELPTTDFRVTCSEMTFCGNSSIKVLTQNANTQLQDIGTHIHQFLQKLTHFPLSEEERMETTKDEPEEIRNRLHQLFERTEQDSTLRPYFYPDATDRILNETSIITESGELKRPDRIVIKPDHVMIIDYKTGQEHRMKYEAQLSEYKHYVEQLGYKDVRTEILYID
jgi:ATP-dependent exoDNAse (exonuclease V) beta subunit